jgi:hypothetical protein
MNQPNNGNWSGSPWIGEFASSNFALWRAGCEWAAKSNWFAGNIAETIKPTLGSPTKPPNESPEAGAATCPAGGVDACRPSG